MVKLFRFISQNYLTLLSYISLFIVTVGVGSCGSADKPPAPDNSLDPTVTMLIQFNGASPCSSYYASGKQLKYDIEIVYDDDDVWDQVTLKTWKTAYDQTYSGSISMKLPKSGLFAINLTLRGQDCSSCCYPAPCTVMVPGGKPIFRSFPDKHIKGSDMKNGGTMNVIVSQVQCSCC